MNMYEEKESGYSPTYTGNDLTDDLHEFFGFRADYKIISYEDFEKFSNI